METWILGSIILKWCPAWSPIQEKKKTPVTLNRFSGTWDYSPLSSLSDVKSISCSSGLMLRWTDLLHSSICGIMQRSAQEEFYTWAEKWRSGFKAVCLPCWRVREFIWALKSSAKQDNAGEQAGCGDLEEHLGDVQSNYLGNWIHRIISHMDMKDEGERVISGYKSLFNKKIWGFLPWTPSAAQNVSLFFKSFLLVWILYGILVQDENLSDRKKLKFQL